MGCKWYFTKNGRDRLGPFSSGQLRQLAASRLLLPTDMVLPEGGQKWVRADKIQGLFPEQMAADGLAPRGLQSHEGMRSMASVSAAPYPSAQPNPSDAREDCNFRGRKFALWLAIGITGGVFLFILLVLVLLASVDNAARVSLAIRIAEFLIPVLIVCAILGLIALITGTRTACPKCKHWWASVYLGRKAVAQKKCYGLVTRYAYSSSTGWLSGSSTQSSSIHHGSFDGSLRTFGSTIWRERVPVIRTTYELHYECKYCRARWTEEKVEEVEDFEKD